MDDPQKVVERLRKNSVSTGSGSLSVMKTGDQTSVVIQLRSFPDRPLGSIFMLSPEEWVRVEEIIKEWLKR